MGSVAVAGAVATDPLQRGCHQGLTKWGGSAVRSLRPITDTHRYRQADEYDLSRASVSVSAAVWSIRMRTPLPPRIVATDTGQEDRSGRDPTRDAVEQARTVQLGPSPTPAHWAENLYP
jgi:hypothetical protein